MSATDMPIRIAASIAVTANGQGWDEVLGRKVRADDVQRAWIDGTHEHESFASFVLQEADEYGVKA